MLLAVFIIMLWPMAGAAEEQTEAEEETYSEENIVEIASVFFGKTTKALAQAITKVFKEQGRPNGYITGTEGSGAIGLGLRYGEGVLNIKSGGMRKVYWQGPSIGFDFGGNLSKVFTLVYHLEDMEDIFQRIPGVDGSLYIIGGISVNYQQTGDLILAPIRSGVGWRAGASVGYLHYTREQSWIPF